MSGIKLFFEGIKPFRINKNNLQKHIDFLIVNEGKTPGAISVIFCNDDYLLQLNEQYLGHHTYTDIVTFDYNENSVLSGDLFISVDRVKDNSGKFQVSFKEELCRVILHGLLHLAGYKDKKEEQKALMQKKENFYLGRMDFMREAI